MPHSWPRSRVLAVASILLLVGAGTWWVIATPLSEASRIKIPERVCNGRVAGHKLAPLLPAIGKKLEERTKYFDEPNANGNFCSLYAGDLYSDAEHVSLDYSDGPSAHYRREWIHDMGIPATLGNDYGYISETGTIRLYIRCNSDPHSPVGGDGRVVISASTSLLKDKELNKSNRLVQALAEFAAQAARDLHDWYGCKGPKPSHEPVFIDWSK
jgi:hypothetical protein